MENQIEKINSIELIDKETLKQTFREFALESLENMVCDLSLSDKASAKQAVSMVLQARKMKKAISEKKEELLEPIKGFQKEVAQNCSLLTKKLEEIEDSLTKKIQEWIEIQNEDPFEHIEKIDVQDGSMTYKYEYDFSVSNIHEVPFNFLKIDEKAIEKALKSGMRSIPGISIKQINYCSFRVKNTEISEKNVKNTKSSSEMEDFSCFDDEGEF